MPYKYETQKLKIPKKHDKRIKLTEAQRQEIRANVEGLSQRVLATKYGVSRRLITFILDPEKHRRNLECREKRGGTKAYYDKEKNTNYMRVHRRRKRILDIKGELIE